METISIVFMFIVALNLYDAYSTFKILKNGGRELNPVLNYLIQKIGLIPSLIAVKAAMLSLLWKYLSALNPLILLIILIFYLYVCVHNFKQIEKIGG